MYHWDAATRRVVDEGGATIVAIGQTVRFAGGERSREHAEDLIGGQIPETCRTNAYWQLDPVSYNG
jgi:hypothetical protein